MVYEPNLETIIDAIAIPSNSAYNRTSELSLAKKLPVHGRRIPGLPEFCAGKLISVSSCDGQTEITTDQGNTYRIVEIGDQCWFAENAKEVPESDAGWYGFYENKEENPSLGQGLLYTWIAGMNGAIYEHTRGVCPKGWGIPSICDFVSRPEFKLFGNNSTMPGSYLKNIGFRYIGKSLYLWSSSEFSTEKSWGFTISSENLVHIEFPNDIENAFSIRCKKL